MVGLQPTHTYKCSAERECSQTDMRNPSAAMLNEQGKCSALLTRVGFFDFAVFRTSCNVSHNVTVVCQHKQKAKVLFHNNMSDMKVSKISGFYRLQLFSSCGVGWFLVDNVCITISRCLNCTEILTAKEHCEDQGWQNCTEILTAQEHCEDQGGQLAYHMLNNWTFIRPAIIVGKNKEQTVFWDIYNFLKPSRSFFNSV